MRLAKWAWLAVAIALGGALWFAAPANADTLRLKNGLTFNGRVVGLNEVAVYSSVRQGANTKVPASCPIWMVDDGPRRLSIPGRQAVELLKEDEITQLVTFKFPQHRTGQANIPDGIGTFSRVEEFDEFGHGMIQLRVKNAPMDVYLGITELRPDYARIESLSHHWNFARTTQSLGGETVERILNQKINRKDLVDRKSMIVFYEQAGMYSSARQEVELFAKDFPSEKAWYEEISSRMDELDAERILNELIRRKAAGQHPLVDAALKAFPRDRVSAKILRTVEQMQSEYQQARERRANLLLQLDMLQAQLSEADATLLRPLRSLLESELHAVENIDRLSPYEQIVDDPELQPSQKLALAYSSWVVGPADAVESLPAAIRLWGQRFLILEYVRTGEDATRRTEILKQLQEQEDISVERLARMVEFLPMLEDSEPIPAGVSTEVTFHTEGAEVPQTYMIVLPRDYNPQHTYPLLVVLHSSGGDAEKEARWWAGTADREGQAQRRGFITIAPRYAQPQQVKHEYDLASHRAVLGAIRHAMRTHRVDADRVVLAGHEMGADACFDLGMSHPDIFAGVAPICGKSQNYCKFYFENGMKLPWYVVSGQRDRDTVAENMRDLNRYFRKGIDIVYCEYKERGLETYSEELPRLMDWAETVRRKPIAEFQEFEMTTLRAFDNRFFWVQAGSLPEELFQPIVWEDPHKKIRTRPITGKITARGGMVYIAHPGKTTTLWFTPEMIAMDKRIHIQINGTEKFHGVVKPSAEALLEDLRMRADRQRLFQARLDL